MSKNTPSDYNSPGPTTQKIEDLLKWVRPIIRRWPKLDREDLGASILEGLRTMKHMSIRAGALYYNQTTLRDLYIEKKSVESDMREASETTYQDKKKQVRKLIEVHSYGVWCEKIDEIGKMIWGWKEKAEAKKSGDKEKPAPHPPEDA